MVEERTRSLEQRMEVLERRMLRVEAVALDATPTPLTSPERPAAREAAPPRPTRRRAAPPAGPVWSTPRPPAASTPATREATAPRVRPDRPAREIDLEQVLGGRVLAWAGGVAVLAGLALLFALAVSRGWIGEEARTAVGGALSSGLFGLGLWLHGRHRTEAARAAAATGIAGLFMTVTVAARVYELVPAAAGLALAFVVGALAAAVAIRWASATIGALGILGALLTPVLVGAPADALTEGFVAVASLSALAVVLRQRWDWLALAIFVLGAPQWLYWMFDRGTVAGGLVALVGFGALYATAALAGEVRLPARRLRTSAALLLGLNTLVLALAGFTMLDEHATRPAAIAWLAALAGAHALAALVAQRHTRISHEISLLCLTLAVVLADVGFGVATDGPVQVLGWAASAVAFAGLVRRQRAGSDGVLAELGLGGHIALAAAQACTELDFGQLAGPGAETAAIAALAALAAGCLISARLAVGGQREWRIVLDSAGLLALATLTALTLDGPALTVAWAAEAVALGAIARRRRDELALIAGLVHLGAASVYAGTTVAPPIELIEGGVAIGKAALGLGAVAAAALAGAWIAGGAAALAAGRREPSDATGMRLAPGAATLRDRLVATGAGTLLYLASLAVVAWAPGAGEDALLQQGQLQLSALWAVAGVVALVVGLRTDLRAVRLAALGLLAVTAGKVFLYDLNALTSVYRVASFIGLGLLLLLAAFAYQRLRPEAPHDLRAMPDALR